LFCAGELGEIVGSRNIVQIIARKHGPPAPCAACIISGRRTLR
jgi:hypothetical protein